MSHKPTDKAAVDEGRNPYGLPGRGNGHEVWRKLTAIPCPNCGARHKTLVIDGDRATVTCWGSQR